MWVAYMKEFEHTGRLAKGCNSNFLTLVPKCSYPVTLHDYRPISLVGCQYMIVAKILAVRLKAVLPHLIFENQTTFTVGHQITDGVLIANEIVRWFATKKKKLLLFKANFAKAFDSINWNFLDSIMKQMNFSDKWRSWIRGCLSYSS